MTESEINVQTIKDKWAARHDDDGGFTLIELLVVIVIIGILSAVVVFSVAGIQDRGDESACKADKSTLTVAQEAHYAQEGSYADEDDLVTAGFLQGESTLYNTAATNNGADYSLTVQNTKCNGV